MIEILVDFVIGAVVVVLFLTVLLKIESQAVINFFAVVGGAINGFKTLIKNL
jgi:hypothetical protein